MNNDPHEKFCVCFSTDQSLQRHHIFRKKFRDLLASRGISTIKLYWRKGDNVVRNTIPVNAYVIFCETCHKLNHPENISYHLNELVVNSLEKAKNNGGGDVGKNFG